MVGATRSRGTTGPRCLGTALRGSRYLTDLPWEEERGLWHRIGMMRSARWLTRSGRRKADRKASTKSIGDERLRRLSAATQLTTTPALPAVCTRAVRCRLAAIPRLAALAPAAAALREKEPGHGGSANRLHDRFAVGLGECAKPMHSRHFAWLRSREGLDGTLLRFAPRPWSHSRDGTAGPVRDHRGCEDSLLLGSSGGGGGWTISPFPVAWTPEVI